MGGSQTRGNRRSTIIAPNGEDDNLILSLDEYTLDVFKKNVEEDAEQVYNAIWDLLREGDKRIFRLEDAETNLKASEAENAVLVEENETLEQARMQAEADVSSLQADLTTAQTALATQAAKESDGATNEQVKKYEAKISRLQKSLDQSRKAKITQRTPTTAAHIPTPSPSEVDSQNEESVSPTPTVADLTQFMSSLKYHQDREAHIQDPPKFGDGKTVDFTNWVKGIHSVFSVKKKTLSTEDARMAYIFSLCEGAAVQRIGPRYMSGKDDQYISANEMLIDLEATFVDPNQVATAKGVFRKMKQGENEHFVLFEQRFYKIAVEAEIGQSEWREELLQKCRVRLREQVYTSQDAHPTYAMLKSHLNLVDRRMRETESEQAILSKTFVKPVKTSGFTYVPGAFAKRAAAAAETTPKSIQLSTKPQAYPSSFALPKPAIKLLMDAPKGDCFICKKPGHYARNCPDAKTTVAEMSGIEVLSFFQEADLYESGGGESSEEISDDDEQGNART